VVGQGRNSVQRKELSGLLDRFPGQAVDDAGIAGMFPAQQAE
jgi:hypothetical protein